MIESLDEFLVGVVIGIRFRANFSVEDQLGRMVDRILYSKDSFFNSDVFPRANSTVGQKTLLNPDTLDSLRIDNSNIIMAINLVEKKRFSLKDLPNLYNKFEEQIIKGVVRHYKITQIVRIGFVKRYLFRLEDLAKTFVDKTIGKTLGGVNDINLRFSKKLPVPDALVRRDVNDHYNAIFNVIKKAELHEIFMAIDFQHYYDPFLDTSADIDFRSFIKQTDTFNSARYLEWLNSNYVEE